MAVPLPVTVHIVTHASATLLDHLEEDVFDHPVRPELLRQFLDNPSNGLAVAVLDGVVVGMATGIAYVHPDKPLALFVNEVGVAARYRRRGVGRRLMVAILEWGKQRGCTEAWVATEDGNAEARALYRSTGGVEDPERAVVFEYSLAKPGASDS